MKIATLGNNMIELKLGGNGKGDKDKMVLFSYSTPVAMFDYSKLYKTDNSKISNETIKHIKDWFYMINQQAEYNNQPHYDRASISQNELDTIEDQYCHWL